jgi:O-antigen/teichoic acid export membrane protein
MISFDCVKKGSEITFTVVIGIIMSTFFGFGIRQFLFPNIPEGNDFAHHIYNILLNFSIGIFGLVIIVICFGGIAFIIHHLMLCSGNSWYRSLFETEERV